MLRRKFERKPLQEAAHKKELKRKQAERQRNRPDEQTFEQRKAENQRKQQRMSHNREKLSEAEKARRAETERLEAQICLLKPKFPKEYRKAMKLLLFKRWDKKAKNIKKINGLIENFCQKYTTIPRIFKTWMNIVEWRVFDQEESSGLTKNAKEIEALSFKHFPEQHNPEWPSFDHEFFKDNEKTLKDQFEYLEFLLSLPHSNLSLAFTTFDELSTNTKAIPTNLHKYYENLEIYKEIRGTDINDGKKFIEVLKKTENDEFVIKNIECQLSQNPWCQNLWKAYIEHLEHDKKNNKALLSVLSRYCRFFICDKKMKEKYQKKIEELTSIFDGISEFWIDSIKFEVHFEGKESAINLLEKALKTDMKDFSRFLDDAFCFAEKHRLKDYEMKIMNAKKQIPSESDALKEYNLKMVTKNLNLDNHKQLKLPFNKGVNFYILENVDYQHLRKLYQTCKCFYFKYRFNLVHKLDIAGKSHTPKYGKMPCKIQYIDYRDDSIAMSPCKIESLNLHNIWLTNTLKIFQCNKISSLFPKISKATLKYLKVYYTWFTQNEFEILTKSKTIVLLYLNEVKIKMENDENLPIDKILAAVPNAHQITVSKAYLTQKTAENLLSLKFQNKFEVVDLQFKPQIDPGLYFEFLEKNLQSKAEVYLYHPNNVREFKNAMEQYLLKWCPKNERPIFNWTLHS